LGTSTGFGEIGWASLLAVAAAPFMDEGVSASTAMMTPSGQLAALLKRNGG